jgi:hypothetical protein
MPSFRLPPIDPVWWYVAAGFAAVLILMWTVARIARVYRTRAMATPEPVPLVIPVHRRGVAEVPYQPLRRDALRAEMEGPTTPAGPTPSAAPFPAAAVQHAPYPQAVASPPAPGHPSNGVPRPSLNGNGGHGAAPPPPISKVVQAVAPVEGTLQFLPGRLEVVDGDVPGRDIRFVRTWGEIPEVTFGRIAGPPYRHVQLRSQTISRQHARMQYVEARWKLTNLSQTNPVVVNGQPLDTAHGQRVLRDGDEIEMGDVLFRFRER